MILPDVFRVVCKPRLLVYLQAPAKEETLQVFERMKDMGVLIGKGGLLGNVFRIKPPMCINEQDADFLLEVMGVALSEL